jgi:hypothetical protein
VVSAPGWGRGGAVSIANERQERRGERTARPVKVCGVLCRSQMQIKVKSEAHFVYLTNKSSQIRLSLAALDSILRRIFFTVLY